MPSVLAGTALRLLPAYKPGSSGGKNFNAARERDRNHGVEKVGLELRRLMSWIDEKEV